MTIREAAKILDAKIVQDEFEDTELSGVYTSDLLSDVMAYAKDGGALVTIQAHKNTVAVATLVDISVIIICNSRPVAEDMIAAAKDKGIAIIVTKLNQYTVSGKLYMQLNKNGQ